MEADIMTVIIWKLWLSMRHSNESGLDGDEDKYGRIRQQDQDVAPGRNAMIFYFILIKAEEPTH